MRCVICPLMGICVHVSVCICMYLYVYLSICMYMYVYVSICMYCLKCCGWHVQDLAGTSGAERIIKPPARNPILSPIRVLLCSSRHAIGSARSTRRQRNVWPMVCAAAFRAAPSLLALYRWNSQRDGQECIADTSWGIEAISALPWRTLRGLKPAACLSRSCSAFCPD